MNAGTMLILLQYYCYGEVRHCDANVRNCDANETFLREAKCLLRNKGLIDREDFPAITDKGRAHVEALLNAPLPEQRWISPLAPKGSA